MNELCEQSIVGSRLPGEVIIKPIEFFFCYKSKTSKTQNYVGAKYTKIEANFEFESLFEIKINKIDCQYDIIVDHEYKNFENIVLEHLTYRGFDRFNYFCHEKNIRLLNDPKEQSNFS